jgi:hypothetical protein
MYLVVMTDIEYPVYISYDDDVRKQENVNNASVICKYDPHSRRRVGAGDTGIGDPCFFLSLPLNDVIDNFLAQKRKAGYLA